MGRGTWFLSVVVVVVVVVQVLYSIFRENFNSVVVSTTTLRQAESSSAVSVNRMALGDKLSRWSGQIIYL